MNWEDDIVNLESFLVSNGFASETIEKLKTKIKFDMKHHQVESSTLINELEAGFLTEPKIDSVLFEIIQKYFDKMTVKNQKKNKQNSANLKNNNVAFQSGKNNSSLKSEKIDFTFNKSTLFNPSNFPDQNYVQYNKDSIKFLITKDLEIDQYSIIPKDDETYLEQYKNYFKTIKSNFLDYLKIDENDPSLDSEKFILLVCFDSSEGKPLMNELVLVDPLKDYYRYTIKLETEFKEILFTGQIIFVQGNLKNSEILCTNILSGIPETTCVMNKKSACESYEKDNREFNIKVCAGPYFSKNNIDFDVFDRVLFNISQENPNALILLGPFLPEDNCMIESGNIIDGSNSLSYEELFFKMLSKDKITTIIIGPSLYDVNSLYPLPQPPFKLIDSKLNLLEIAQRVKFIGNPQTFFINNIIFGVSNFDFMKEIIANSLKGSIKPPLDSVLESVILQRSYFPLLPTVISQEENDPNEKAIILDYRKCEHLSFLKFIPDIIISPSLLQPIAKQSKNTLFINPGFIFKGENLGSYASLSIYCPNNNNDLDILKRIKSDIVKLYKVEKMIEDI